jgi:hypothetical protein
VEDEETKEMEGWEMKRLSLRERERESERVSRDSYVAVFGEE